MAALTHTRTDTSADSASDTHLARWLDHVRALCVDIGPRGSTTEAERRASAYCANVLAGIGLAPRTEGFTSATSAFLLYLYVGSAFIAAGLIYPFAGRISAAMAALIAFTGVYSICMELLYRNNPFRRLLPKAPSQNVIATLDPAAEHEQDLILIGHVDTNHAALIFRTNGWVNVWRFTSSMIFFSFVAQVILYVLGAIYQPPGLWPAIALPGLIAGAVLAAFMIEGERAPFTCGANDNATAAGLILALAERLKAEPLKHTRVWFVCSGCEEVKHYGAINFLRRHRAELHRPRALVFEMLGCDGPAYLVKESTISLFTFRASPELVSIAERVASACPELRAHPTKVDGGHTEMNDALRFGIPAITFIGLDEGGTRYFYDGPEIYWHRIDDIFDKLIPEVMARNYTFTWEFIRALDAKAAS